MGYLIPAVIVVALLEVALVQATWVPFYYRRGIRIYSREFAYAGEFRPQLIEKTLEQEFRGIVGPAVALRALLPDELAFRECFFQLRLLSYTPLMHGLARVDPVRKVATVSGYLNYYPVAFVAMWYAVTCGFSLPGRLQDNLLWYAAPLLIFAVIYAIQVAVYGKVVRLIKGQCGGL